MSNRSQAFLALLLSLVILSFATQTISAQTATHNVAILNGGRNVISLNNPSHLHSSDSFDPSEFVTIYSNLGTGDQGYNSIAGVGVLGTDAGEPHPQRCAFSFTPDADHVVQAIRIGAGHVSGPNSIILSLHNDNGNGRPGAILDHWEIENLPVFGSCCRIVTVKTRHGIPVRRGKSYWVVLRTADETTFDVWNNDFFGENGPFSNNVGNGWLDGGIQQQGAFGVFGQ